MPDTRRLTDRQLIQRILAGDEAASDALARRVKPSVEATAAKILARRAPDSIKDVVGETFLRLWASDDPGDTSQSRKPRVLAAFKGEDLAPYACTVARHLAYDVLEDAGRGSTDPDIATILRGRTVPVPTDDFTAELVARRLARQTRGETLVNAMKYVRRLPKGARVLYHRELPRWLPEASADVAYRDWDPAAEEQVTHSEALEEARRERRRLGRQPPLPIGAGSRDHPDAPPVNDVLDRDYVQGRDRPSSEETLIVHETRDRLRGIMQNVLTEREFAVIHGLHFEDLDRVELAKRLGITPNHLDQINFRARHNKLAPALQEERDLLVALRPSQLRRIERGGSRSARRRQ